MAKDPLRGSLRGAQSLNRYLYAANNPINIVDPAGLRGEEPPPVAIWTTREMVRNVQSVTLKTILVLNKMNRNSVGIAATSSKLSALALFGWMVRQRGPWDPKPYIEDHSIPPHSQQIGQYWYYYDVWGNVMFGYLGSAAGFQEWELLNGGGLAQLVTDVRWAPYAAQIGGCCRLAPMPRPWHNFYLLWAFDHPQDRVTTRMGIRLWREHETGVKTRDIIEAVVQAGDTGEIERRPEPWPWAWS